MLTLLIYYILFVKVWIILIKLFILSIDNKDINQPKTCLDSINLPILLVLTIKNSSSFSGLQESEKVLMQSCSEKIFSLIIFLQETKSVKFLKALLQVALIKT